MSENVDIVIVDLVGSGHCTASEDGQKVYDLINESLKAGKEVHLSFKGVEDLTTAFLNTAVGQLYGEYSEGEIKSKVSVSDAAQDDLLILKRVVERAKEFFKDNERYKAATDEALGGSDGN